MATRYGISTIVLLRSVTGLNSPTLFEGTNTGCTFTNTINSRAGRESDWPLLAAFLATIPVP
jgi:hypothetical protein